MKCPNCGRNLNEDNIFSMVPFGEGSHLIIDCPCGAMIYADLIDSEVIVRTFRITSHKEDFQNRPLTERTFRVLKNGWFSENVPFDELVKEVPGIEGMRIGDYARGQYPGSTKTYQVVRVTNLKPKISSILWRKLRCPTIDSHAPSVRGILRLER